FSEISAEISGRKNCKETILCSGRLRFASLPTQKSLLGPAKLALRIEIGGTTFQNHPVNTPALRNRPLFFAPDRSGFAAWVFKIRIIKAVLPKNVRKLTASFPF
ncbi:MAG: hypothetical protein IK140_06910, partial [Clostridia bacterium]|nr:hypothetical protein [Clostridia bacterium]